MNFSSDKQDWGKDEFLKAHSHLSKEVATALWEKHFSRPDSEEKPIKEAKKKAEKSAPL